MNSFGDKDLYLIDNQNRTEFCYISNINCFLFKNYQQLRGIKFTSFMDLSKTLAKLIFGNKLYL